MRFFLPAAADERRAVASRSRRGFGRVVLSVLLLAACQSSVPPAPRWLKGQLHAHTDRSGDCQTGPRRVLERYAELGFDFLVLTDHNQVTVMPDRGGMRVFPGIELTQNLRACAPGVEGPPCLLHLNALFADPGPGFTQAADGVARLEALRRATTWGHERGAVLQLNHPNFFQAADPDTVASLVSGQGVSLLEIANQSPDVDNAGQGSGRSTEQLWDEVLSRGLTVWGTATDDAHDYDAYPQGREPSLPGQGWVRVWAVHEREPIRQALLAGRFYATTGVELSRAGVEEGALVVEVEPRTQELHRFTLVGQGGAVLGRSQGRSVRFPLTGGSGGYVRALVEDARGNKAWVQPVRLP